MSTATIEENAIELRIPNTLAADTRASLEAVLRPIFDSAQPLCVKAREIVVTDPDDKDGMKLAYDTRQSIKKIRVNAEKERKRLKEEALRTGQAIDGIFRPFDQALTAHEEYLSLQETFAERLETERKARLKAERDGELVKLGANPEHFNTSDMTLEAWMSCVAGIKAQREAERQAAEQARKDQEAAEKAAAEQRERIRLDNERLQREAAEREQQMQAEREKAAAERQAIEAKARAEREAIEAKARKEREAAEAVARKEREAREKLEREHREREAAEAKRKADEARAAAKAARAPDADKLRAFAAKLAVMEFPTCKAEEAKAIVREGVTRISVLVKWIEDQAGTL